MNKKIGVDILATENPSQGLVFVSAVNVPLSTAVDNANYKKTAAIQIGVSVAARFENASFRVLCSSANDLNIVTGLLEMAPGRVEVVLTKPLNNSAALGDCILPIDVDRLALDPSRVNAAISIDHFQLRDFNSKAKKALSMGVSPAGIPGLVGKILLMSVVWGDPRLGLGPATAAVALSSASIGSSKLSEIHFLRSLCIKRGVEFHNLEVESLLPNAG
jgi:hypothetical protein